MEKNNLLKIFTIAIAVELIIVILIAILDPRPCPSEEYSLKWLQALQLIIVALLAFKISQFNSEKIRSFWIFVGAAFIWVTLDELFMFHEQIADKILSKTIIGQVYPFPLDSLIIATYFLLVAVFLIYFFRPVYRRYKGEKWLYNLVLAISFHAYAVLADVLSWSCSEEYAETFAGLFYILALITVYLKYRKNGQ